MTRDEMIDLAVRNYGPFKAADAFGIHPDGQRWRLEIESRKRSDAMACIIAEFRRITTPGAITYYDSARSLRRCPV